MEGGGVGHRGGAGQVQFDVAEQRVVLIDEGEIDVNHAADAGIGETFGDLEFFAVGSISELLAEGGVVVLAVGVLNVGDRFGAFVNQVHAPTQQVAGGTHAGRI